MTNIKVKGIKELEDGNLEITTKDGVFVLEDPISDDLNRAVKRNKGSEVYGILSTMIIKKNGEDAKIGELTLKKFKASTITKLQAGADMLLGGEDFLSENGNIETTVDTEE